MILYYPTKFHLNTMSSFGVMGRGHFPSPPPPPRAQAPRNSPGQIGLISNQYVRLISFLRYYTRVTLTLLTFAYSRDSLKRTWQSTFSISGEKESHTAHVLCRVVNMKSRRLKSRIYKRLVLRLGLLVAYGAARSGNLILNTESFNYSKAIALQFQTFTFHLLWLV